MMRVENKRNALLSGYLFTGLIPNGTMYDVDRVDIGDPARIYETLGIIGNGVYKQGEARGSSILCGDGGRAPQRLHGLTPAGTVFPFCENNVVLNGFKGITDYARSQTPSSRCARRGGCRARAP